MYLSPKASRARLREAENARNNRREIVKAYSTGQISRRDLIRWGVITAGGLLLPINGLSPFASSVYADGIPTGAPPSPLFGVQPFDALTFTSVVTLLFVTAAVACLIPAWRALQIPPTAALRAE